MRRALQQGFQSKNAGSDIRVGVFFRYFNNDRACQFCERRAASRTRTCLDDHTGYQHGCSQAYHQHPPVGCSVGTVERMVHRFAGSVASGFGEVSRKNISAAPAASMGGMNAIMPRVIKALIEKTLLKFGASLSNAFCRRWPVGLRQRARGQIRG